jgi:hypothetical protein
MRRFSVIAILGLLLEAAAFTDTAKSGQDGQTTGVTITGQVLEVRRSVKGNAFLYLDDRYPNQRWTIFIAARNTVAFGSNKQLRDWESRDVQGYDGKTIQVSKGEIRTFEGEPVVEIASPSQVKILKP